MKTVLIVLAALTLAGCYVEPVAYSPVVYAPTPVVVAPAPVYVAPPVVYGYYGPRWYGPAYYGPRPGYYHNPGNHGHRH